MAKQNAVVKQIRNQTIINIWRFKPDVLAFINRAVYNNKVYRGGIRGCKHKMDSYTLINLACLCIVNGFFTFAGILLNSVVIICLWKCTQLRRKTCYFLIQVLSCFDLGAIMVGHPTTILQSFAFSLGDNTALRIARPYSLRSISFCCIAHNKRWSISCDSETFLLPSLRNQIQTSKIHGGHSSTVSCCPNNACHSWPTYAGLHACNSRYCWLPMARAFHKLQYLCDR